ncbi:MAG TPA: hypothetical protein VHT31_03045, partial [Candidatus Acidoferrum sp.]|nr:hypothetical protein [Candidatus Acidoferrum sp.]
MLLLRCSQGRNNFVALLGCRDFCCESVIERGTPPGIDSAGWSIIPRSFAQGGAMLTAAIVTVTHRILALTDLVIIGIYFAIIFGIGFYFAKKGRTSEDYFLAGRNI